MTCLTPRQADDYRESLEEKAQRDHARERAIMDELEETGGSTLAGRLDALDIIEECQDEELFYLLFKFWASCKQGNKEKRSQAVIALENKLDNFLVTAVTEAVSNEK